MTHTTVRQIQGDEMLETLCSLDNYAFRPSPPLADRAGWQDVMEKREGVVYSALFEEDVGVSVAAVSPLTQQVRGALFGMADGVCHHSTAPPGETHAVGVAATPRARSRGPSPSGVEWRWL